MPLIVATAKCRVEIPSFDHADFDAISLPEAPRHPETSQGRLMAPPEPIGKRTGF